MRPVLAVMCGLCWLSSCAPAARVAPPPRSAQESPPPDDLATKPVRTDGAPSHFVDVHGNTLERFDDSWQLLRAFYGPSTPERFRVEYDDDSDGASHFDPDSRTAILALQVFKKNPRPTLVHEASHVCLAELTERASVLEQFRFIDEGLASILENRVEGVTASHRKAAFQTARNQLAVGNLSIQKLQKWSSYFGTPGKTKRNGFAYPVGASFDYYLLERFGEPAFLRFLVDLGKTRDLSKSTEAVLGSSLEGLEAAWIAEIEKLEPMLAPPRLIELSPAQGGNVETSLKEITATFDTDMLPDVCVLVTNCGEGLCYTGARWKGPRTLSIEADRALLPNHEYRIELGAQGRCSFKSIAGLDFEPVVWTFQTK